MTDATAALPSFRSAARTALTTLAARTAAGAWLLARADGDGWVVVDCVDRAYGVRPGAALDLPAGAAHGPEASPTHVAAPLPGTGLVLAGVDHRVRPGLAAELPLVEALAALLGSVLVQEARAADAVRRASKAEAEALLDPLTGLGTRLAWNRALAEEEARCRRTGRPACVVSIDLDGLKRLNDESGHDAGDALLRRAALVLRRASRLLDHVVRIGGDEFAVLAGECPEEAGETLCRRIGGALAAAGVEASLGVAVRVTDVESAWRTADARMYEEKRARRQIRVARALAQAPSPRVPAEGTGVHEAAEALA